MGSDIEKPVSFEFNMSFNWLHDTDLLWPATRCSASGLMKAVDMYAYCYAETGSLLGQGMERE